MLYLNPYCQELIRTNEIQLALTGESALSLITDFETDSQGNFIIADGWKIRKVFVFNIQGEFVRFLGNRGQGPGEYLTPLSLAVNSEKEIYISDYMGNKILVFDDKYIFRRSINIKPRVHYFLHLSRSAEIYFYDGSCNRRTSPGTDTIFKYLKNGGFEKSFSPLSDKVIKMDFSAIYNGMAIDKDNNIFQMHPLEYRIIKYDSNVKAILEYDLPAKFQRLENLEFLNGPYCTDNYLIVQRNERIDVFDLFGKLVRAGISLPHRILKTRNNKIYAEDNEDDAKNPKIIVYIIR